MKSARQYAFEILMKIEKEGAFSNLAVDATLANVSLSPKDKAFVSALVYGCIERKITLDYQIERYLSKPINKLKTAVLIVLRLGTYQLLFMDKIPASAAVNESVKLAKENKSDYASGLVNAVLRSICSNGLVLPDEKDEKLYFSVKYSCPESLIGMWKKAYGQENTEELLKASLEKPDTVLRVNTLKINEDELISLLKEEGVEAEKSNFIENALVVQKLGCDIESLPSFKNGFFHVQDTASQFCVKLLAPENGERILDLCSAPGGKSFTAAQYMENDGNILAFDIYPSRTELIDKSAERLGIENLSTCVCDATKHYDKIEKADRVLCDVPCSGLGVIRRKPEIKYKPLDDFKSLPDIQYKILCNGASYVKKGGRLVYSTCTLNKKENDKICDLFLSEHPEFKCLRPLDLPSVTEKYYTFTPHLNGCDGFFAAVFERIEDDI